MRTLKKVANRAANQSEPRTKVPTAKVSEATLEKIEQLARRFSVGSSVVAGALLETGIDLISRDDIPRLAGTSQSGMLWKILMTKHTKHRHQINVLPELSILHNVNLYAQYFSRPISDMMGQLIELALPHATNRAIAEEAYRDPVYSRYQVSANRIKEDWDEDVPPEFLKPDVDPPSPFLTFEQTLAKGIA